MSNTVARIYDPAFIEWWNQQTLSAKVALAISTLDHCAYAWEAAVRLVKSDCTDAHSRDNATMIAQREALEWIQTLCATKNPEEYDHTLHVDIPETVANALAAADSLQEKPELK